MSCVLRSGKEEANQAGLITCEDNEDDAVKKVEEIEKVKKVPNIVPEDTLTAEKSLEYR